MCNIDIEVYFGKFKQFFKDNPLELSKIIGKASPEEFFDEVYNIIKENHDKGQDLELTKKQIINITLKINKIIPKDELSVQIFQNTKFGEICLN